MIERMVEGEEVMVGLARCCVVESVPLDPGVMSDLRIMYPEFVVRDARGMKLKVVSGSIAEVTNAGRLGKVLGEEYHIHNLIVLPDQFADIEVIILQVGEKQDLLDYMLTGNE